MNLSLPGAVRLIADFMGVELSRDEFEAVVHQSSFAFMKQINHKFEPGMIVPWAAKERSMIRRGACGASSELLTAEQQQRIDAHWDRELKAAGCDFPYRKFFGPREWFGAGC